MKKMILTLFLLVCSAAYADDLTTTGYDYVSMNDSQKTELVNTLYTILKMDKNVNAPEEAVVALNSFYQFHSIEAYSKIMGNPTSVKEKDRREAAIKAIFDRPVMSVLAEQISMASPPTESHSKNLFEAIWKGDLEGVKVAVQKGADVNEKNIDHGTPLDYAICEERLDIVKFLVEHGANIEMPDVYGQTPLYVAVLKDNLDIVKCLVEKGADVNRKENTEGSTPLMAAAKIGSLDILSYLISKGANINEANNSGYTALSLAYAQKHQVIVDYLEGRPIDKKTIATEEFKKAVEKADLEGIKSALNKGADINAKIYGRTPSLAYIAVDAPRKSENSRAAYLDREKKCFVIAQFLVEHGADPNAKDDRGTPILLYITGQLSPDQSNLIKSLVEKGADIKVKDSKGQTPAMRAAYAGNLEIVSYLVEKGANLKEKDNLGDTILMYASEIDTYSEKDKREDSGLAKGDEYSEKIYNRSALRLKLIEYLLANGIGINEKNNSGWTALANAVIGHRPNVAKYLIEHGADVNVQDHDGNSLLMISSDPDLVKYLVEHGAKLDLKDNKGQTALDAAKKAKNWEIIEYLASVSKNKDIDIDLNAYLLESIQKRNFEEVKSLISKGAAVNGIDDKTVPLHYAISRGTYDIIKYLVEHGADVNGKVRYFLWEEWDGSPLMLALTVGINQSRSNVAVQYLVEKGAKVTYKDKQGSTPLMFSVRFRNLATVQYLLEKGAEINVQDNKGNTPLICAVQVDSYDKVKYLVDKGADINVKNGEGKTALDIAKDKSYYEIVDYLKTKAN